MYKELEMYKLNITELKLKITTWEKKQIFYTHFQAEDQDFILCYPEDYKFTLGDQTNKNQLINGLTISFNKIANRIDNGFTIDIRVETLSSNDDELVKKMVNSIKQSSESLEFINTSVKPILKLDEGKEEENGDTDN
jgi:hypothetical protein